MKRVSIHVISNRDHKPQFVGSLYALTQHLTNHGEKYGVVAHAVSIGCGHSCLPMGRQQALLSARKLGASHILFIDDDMTFAPDMLQHMISRNLPVVAANCVTKSDTPRYTALNEQRKPISSKDKTGVEEVYRVGMGVMLIELAAIEHIQPPHFEVLWDKTGYISEDLYFCDKLRNAGIKIYIDHDVSQHIGHIGDYVYTMHDALMKGV